MSHYHYFAASLPMLMPDTPPPLSVATFRDECATHLARHDLAALDELLGGAPASPPHPFARAWQQTDTQLRNALARLRAQRLEKDASPYLREVGSSNDDIEQVVADAYNRPSPLEREKALDRIRWDRLDMLAGMDPFTDRAVLAYGLQLSILERWAQMDKETGAAAVDSLVRRRATDEEDKS